MPNTTESAFGTIAILIQAPLEDEIADDLSGEQETLQGSVPPDGSEESRDGDTNDPPIGGSDLQNPTIEAHDVADISEYQSRLLAVSKAVTERTAMEYQMYALHTSHSLTHSSPPSQMAKFVKFLLEHRLVQNNDDVFKPQPHADTPWWICFWILVTQVSVVPPIPFG